MRKKIVSLLLTLVFICGAALPAYADEADMARVEGGLEISQEYADEVRAMRNGGIFDDEELEKMMEEFITAHKLKKENISIGFVYTATGDTWYYNPDTWYYPGSMYKIPLMMLLAEQVSSGMLTQDGPFEGMTVSQYEEHILTYSNNDYAHRMRKYLGEGDDKVWRKAAQAYANMPEDSYNPDYMDYSYFSARYLTEVLTTLYNGGEERFPNIIPCMKKANPNHYFALSSQMADYEIAQKYGSFIDNNNRNWNGTAGIIYTPNPIILTVLTLDAPSYEKVIGDAAVMMTEYALKVDENLESYRQAQAEKEEAARREAERAAQEAAAAAEAEAGQQTGAQTSSPAQQTQRTERKLDLKRLALILGIGAVLLVAVVIGLYAAGEKRRKRERYEEYRRRFEEELRQEQERERRRRQEE